MSALGEDPGPSSTLHPSPAPTALAPLGNLRLRHLTGSGLSLQSPGTQHVGLVKRAPVTKRYRPGLKNKVKSLHTPPGNVSGPKRPSVLAPLSWKRGRSHASGPRPCLAWQTLQKEGTQAPAC